MFSARTKCVVPRLVRMNSTKTQPSVKTGVPSTSPMPSKSIAAVTQTLPQSPNRSETWSTMQRPRPAGGSSALFEQTDMSVQPMPLSAMELVAEDPIRVVHGRRAVCDGGGGPLGHPKIFINLDKPGPKPCGYCGIRFEQTPHHGHGTH